VNKDSLFVIADQLLIQEPEDAIKYKMVDQLAYKDEVLDILCKKTGVSNEKDLKMVTLKKYKNVPSINISTAKDKIAVIYAVGSIEGGNGDDQTIGSERISKAIRTARMDQHVKAIVLRINSPGGSALASDVIWREVELARKIKPVVASMGDVAASGGYYIACAADTIIAQPTTITGSIGVFGVLFNSQKLFNNKLGITFDGVKTGKYADLGSAVRPLTDSERLIIQNSVNKIYEDFTTKVAEGRKMPLEEVKKIAEGRVWSGTDAQRIGLVDVLGNFDDAVHIAAQMAKLADYRVISLPEQTDPFSKIMNDLSGDASAWITAKQLGEQYQYYKQVQEALKMQGVQARLPFDMNIR
jgi:protease-4